MEKEIIGYDTSIVLTYYECKKPPNLTGIYDELDFMNDDYYSDLCYQNEILNVFKLESYVDDIVNSKTELIYQQCINAYPEFIDICLKNAAQNMSEDPILGFMMFFSYDYFHIVHKFICCVFNHHDSVEEIRDLMMKLDK